jgi:signal transduction histidine kinase
VALYMELDERAQDLGRAADLKSRVLSDISHEVRTPLNAIINVSRLLLDRLDGELTPEQERQVRMIRDSAKTVTDLVNDLLELARMEAGKTVARVGAFSAADLFAALRGMFRPLATSDTVALLLDDVSSLPALETDEGKLGQILRNLISNALKFTERGQVRVSAELRGGDLIAFSVADTGLGIAEEDRELIFQEFLQIENPLQRRSHGTGLGLPLSRKLVSFLGGELTLQSRVGQGSTFTAIIPRKYSERRMSSDRDQTDENQPGSLPGAGARI